MSSARLISIIVALAVLVLVVDQVSKWWVIEVMDLRRRGQVDVLPPFLRFRMAWNTGINFGIPIGGPWLLIALSLAISSVLVWWVLRRGSGALAAGAGLVVGGALGNAYDRFAYPEQAVADFLNMSCCGIDNPFSFNVADIAIFAGAVWIALRA